MFVVKIVEKIIMSIEFLQSAIYSAILLIILLSLSDYFGNYLKIIDYPDNKRKRHTKPTSLFGGTAIFFSFLTYILILRFNFNFNGDIAAYTYIIFMSLIFMLGFMDDKYDISPKKKILILTVILFTYLTFKNNFEIDKLEFTSFRHQINMGLASVFFLTFCSLLFINALNMTDGENGLCSLIQIIILLILVYFNQYSLSNYHKFTYIFLLILFLIFNIRGKVFLGDSGVYLGSFIIINNIFYTYNKVATFKVEQIFILLMVPGIDMFRVFLLRIINKKNPFSGDRMHLHHLLSNKFKNSFVLLIYTSLIIFPNLISIIYPAYTFATAILTIIVYSWIIFKLK
jgi:UDP-GlcNAc:undecaprenyl-phosphate GlcNAc-1-phosphate transferase